MGRIIAIDYGKKKTGLAVSDPMKIIAGGLTTLPSHLVIHYLKEYIKSEEVELIIVGEPRQMDYSPSENMPRVERFIEKLTRAIPNTAIKLVDERFTSVMAHQAIIESGIGKKKRQNKELVDEISAIILLQYYLETIRQ